MTRITSRDSERGAVEALRWTGEVRLNETHLLDPLRRRKPTTYAVGFHGDLFRLPPAQIDRVFAVMALCPQHRFLLLSKAVEQMREYFADLVYRTEQVGIHAEYLSGLDRYVRGSDETTGSSDDMLPRWPLPLPHVWPGISASNQFEADARIPVLLQVPAAHRFVFLEPLIGAVDLKLATPCDRKCNEYDYAECPGTDGLCIMQRHLDWVIVGGESGRDARPCDVAWIRSVVEQCRAAEVPCFVKQLGTYAIEEGEGPAQGQCGRLVLRDRKGADPAEWPEDLRVQQIPEALCLS